MIITLDIPEYFTDKGVKEIWGEHFQISTRLFENEFLITANKAGLISLATQLLTLAQDDVLSGTHIHYDAYNSLENDSVAFIIQKE